MTAVPNKLIDINSLKPSYTTSTTIDIAQIFFQLKEIKSR